jgi:hypothetical protein
VYFAIDQMISVPMRLLISDLAAKVGISQKHLINVKTKAMPKIFA